jgi:hypothetical protein
VLSGLTPRQTFSATQCGLLEVPTFRNMMRSRQGTRLAAAECLLLALSRHAQCADECPLLGAKRTLPRAPYRVSRALSGRKCAGALGVEFFI